MGFTRAQLASFAGHTCPDLVPANLRLLFVGINPSLWTAATGAHFARPGNRFYPALFAAGITPHLIDAADGYSDADRTLLLSLGIGVTNLVAEATARADELSTQQLRDGRHHLLDVVAQHRPRVVAMLGVTAYRTAFSQPKAQLGEQSEGMGGARLFVLPNPSGLNAHETIATLANWYRDAALAAGFDLPSGRSDT